ncbi:MAG: hypothetical protein K6L76_14070 [Agarilytica sp.]
MEHENTSVNAPLPAEQIQYYVQRVEGVVVLARELLNALSPKNEDNESSVQLNEAQLQEAQHGLQASEKQCEEIVCLYRVFTAWESSELPAVEKSEVVRALGLIKRANVLAENAQRILKEMLGIPDPERQQKEMEMHLRSMGVIRG